MPNQTNTSLVSTTSAYTIRLISPVIKFWLYLIFLIPSIICTLFVLYHLLSVRNLRRALNNHVIIGLLILGLGSEVTVYPWMLYYYTVGNTWKRSFLFCQIWAFIDWAFLCSTNYAFCLGFN